MSPLHTTNSESVSPVHTTNTGSVSPVHTNEPEGRVSTVASSSKPVVSPLHSTESKTDATSNSKAETTSSVQKTETAGPSILDDSPRPHENLLANSKTSLASPATGKTSETTSSDNLISFDDGVHVAPPQTRNLVKEDSSTHANTLITGTSPASNVLIGDDVSAGTTQVMSTGGDLLTESSNQIATSTALPPVPTAPVAMETTPDLLLSDCDQDLPVVSMETGSRERQLYPTLDSISAGIHT